ncbi:MAG: hypothetical protein A3J75_01620 [Acidobacteria bacterium RBG_16_68_9]|nr:MAG: hypothetical protein A3J75_01620 [Acidobacteria bacterium RBG_16_68_9]
MPSSKVEAASRVLPESDITQMIGPSKVQTTPSWRMSVVSGEFKKIMWLLTRVPIGIPPPPSMPYTAVVSTPWASLNPCMPVFVTMSSSTWDGALTIAGDVPALLAGPATPISVASAGTTIETRTANSAGTTPTRTAATAAEAMRFFMAPYSPE